MFRQAIEQHGLVLAQDTAEVPNDGCYYVLLRGAVTGRFRSLTKAQAAYKAIKATLPLEVTEVPKPTIAEIKQRELETMSNKQLLWTDEDFARVERMTRGKKGTRSGG